MTTAAAFPPLLLIASAALAAWAVAAVLTFTVAAFALSAWIRRGPEDGFRMALLRLLNELFLAAFHRLRWTPAPPAEPVPLHGPAIVVANHRSGLDPLVIAASTKRRVRFLMAREYYQIRGLQWVFRVAGCIPVNRENPELGAAKKALQVLREGGVIGIFPQGGIRSAEEDVAGKAGAALLALRSGAPVVPAGISGTPNLDSVLRAIITPSRSRIDYGEPIRLGGRPERGGRDALEEASREILGKVAELIGKA